MKTIACVVAFIASLSLILYSCSKGDGGGGSTSNNCSGVSISVTATVTDTDAGTGNGSIAASASGGSGTLTYSINGGAFQSSGTFNNLAKGSYTVTAKDSKGCTGSASFTVNENNACAGSTITITATSTSSDPCIASGSITATAGGGTSFTYSLNGGAFQASNLFNNVSPGAYTVTAKDGTGCSKNTNVTVATAAAGPLFTAVKGVVTANCALSGCHSGSSPTGGINFTVDCNIVINKERIKARAIDGNPSIMPPTGALPQADRDKITAWLTAGGKFTD